MKRRILTKSALGLSSVLIILWLILGATSSLAWFQADDTIVNNLFFGDLDIELYYKYSGSYKKVDQTTPLLTDEALYEPGYTQVIYLEIVNEGDVSFSYQLSVVPDASATVIGTSVLGNPIDLADYIKFGLVIGDTEDEVMQVTADRDAARKIATEKVSNYSSNQGSLSAGGKAYAALIVHMPTTVGNEANYRGDKVPSISLDFVAKADQIRN